MLSLSLCVLFLSASCVFARRISCLQRVSRACLRRLAGDTATEVQRGTATSRCRCTLVRAHGDQYIYYKFQQPLPPPLNALQLPWDGDRARIISLFPAFPSVTPLYYCERNNDRRKTLQLEYIYGRQGVKVSLSQVSRYVSLSFSFQD
jgi:hypothetical protein